MGLTDELTITGDREPVVQALSQLPQNILNGFTLNQPGIQITTGTAKKIEDCWYGKNTIQVTIENSHFSGGLETPIIRVPKEATDIYSITPSACLNSLGGIHFRYKINSYVFQYQITGKGKEIVEENTTHRYVKEHRKVLIDEGTEIITRATNTP